ncbi:MAG TPA: DUF362 domain-containing protein [bacterium]
MKKYSRRDFLKISASAAALAILPKVFFAAKKEIKKGPLVGVARGKPAKLVKAAIDAIGGMEKFVAQGSRVLIKPNIAFAANAESGATTSADIVKQVVELCLNAGAATIVIGEHTIASAELCANKSNIRSAIVDEEKVSLLLFTKKRQFTETTVAAGKVLTTVEIASELQKVDVIINLPVAKSHSATGVSLGMKNLMGLIWDRNFFHYTDLDQTIAELATVIKPDLNIIDATRVLTDGGPGGPGETAVLNTVVASTDIVAADSYAVGLTPWYGKSFKGTEVKHIIAAAELGVGEIDTARMDIKEIKV